MSKSVGRPRSVEVDKAIIKAASYLFCHQAYTEISMEAISQRAGISKATLYRRWPNKPTLAVEVLVRAALAKSRPFTDISYREHLIANLQALRDMLASPYAAVLVALIAQAQHDTALREILYQQFLKPIQAVGDADLDEAIKRGEVIADIDKDLLFDQLFGLFYYRMLVTHKNVKDAEIEKIVDAFFIVASSK